MLDVLRLLSPIPHTSQLHLQFDLRYSSSTNWRCIVSNVNGFPARRTVCASFTLGGQGKQSVPSRLGRRNPVVFECSWERFEIDGASGWFDVVLACFSPMPKYHDRAMRHTNRHYQSRQDSEAQHGKLHLNFEVEGATNMQGSRATGHSCASVPSRASAHMARGLRARIYVGGFLRATPILVCNGGGKVVGIETVWKLLKTQWKTWLSSCSWHWPIIHGTVIAGEARRRFFDMACM